MSFEFHRVTKLGYNNIVPSRQRQHNCHQLKEVKRVSKPQDDSSSGAPVATARQAALLKTCESATLETARDKRGRRHAASHYGEGIWLSRRLLGWRYHSRCGLRPQRAWRFPVLRDVNSEVVGRRRDSVRVCAPLYRVHQVFHQRPLVPRGLHRPYKASERNAHPRSSRAYRSECSREAQTTKGNEVKGDADALLGNKDQPCHKLARGGHRCLSDG